MTGTPPAAGAGTSGQPDAATPFGRPDAGTPFGRPGTTTPSEADEVWSVPVRGLLLDIDDTLVDTGGAMGTALRAAAQVGWPTEPSAIWAAYADRYYADPGGFFDAYTRGATTFDGMRRARSAEAAVGLGLPALDNDAFGAAEARYRQVFAHAQRLFDDVEPLLVRAAAAGVPVGLLTNSGDAVTADKLAACGLTGRCPVVVTTDTLGFGKPDARVFAHACRLLGLDPRYVVVVGDTIGTDILGARGAGLRAAWLQRPGMPEPRDAGWGRPVPDEGVRIIASLSELEVTQAEAEPC